MNRQQFLEPGESVLMISMVKKIQKLTNKKVQLILTNKPKLIYVDPSKLVMKGNIIWSDNPNDLSIQVINPSYFKICTVRVSEFLRYIQYATVFIDSCKIETPSVFLLEVVLCMYVFFLHRKPIFTVCSFFLFVSAKESDVL